MQNEYNGMDTNVFYEQNIKNNSNVVHFFVAAPRSSFSFLFAIIFFSNVDSKE